MPEFMDATALEAAALLFDMCRVELEGHGFLEGASMIGGSNFIAFRFKDGSSATYCQDAKVRLR